MTEKTKDKVATKAAMIVENQEESKIENESSILDVYLEEHSLGFYKDSEKFRNYYAIADGILDHTNFLLFPIEEIKSTDDGKITNRVFRCDLVVEDNEFENGIQTYSIEIDWKTLQGFDSLKSYLGLQAPMVRFFNLWSKNQREELCSDIQRWLLEWFKQVYWCKTSEKLNRLWFRGKDNQEFVFNNWVLNLNTREFTPWVYELTQNASINISYPLGLMKNLTLKESLTDILSLKKYISSDETVSCIVVWQLVAWIFRIECKANKNEFPFLGIQSITGAWKTSMLNFISWVCWFDWDTILWTNDSDYAFEVWMNWMNCWFYFFDEIQKASSKLLKYVQAAYNSGENHKWWWGWNWWQLQSFRKDCTLICCWEIIPNEEEALLNRFIILDTKEPFLIKKNVTDKEEFKKYEELTGEKVDGEYLTTGQIKRLAKEFYRPRFLNILRNKKYINFEEVYKRASKITDDVAKEFGANAPDTRIVNNLSTAIAGYMLLLWDEIDEAEIRKIIQGYFTNYLEFRKDSYVTWRIVGFITENIGNFCSWTNKVKWSTEEYPAIYLKNSNKEKWLAIQISKISRYMVSKLDLNLKPKHAEQQVRGAFDAQRIKAKPVNVAGWNLKMSATFIDFEKIKDNEFLKWIWDISLDYLWEHVKELKKMKDEGLVKYTMANPTLIKLIEEMDESYENSEFFNTSSFSKEIPLEEQQPF